MDQEKIRDGATPDDTIVTDDNPLRDPLRDPEEDRFPDEERVDPLEGALDAREQR